MASSWFPAFFFVLFTSSLLSTHSCRGDQPPFTKHLAALFIFGDSLADAGNNNYINTTADFQANFFPYGETFFRFPTGRFTNGRIIPDFIAEYANLPLILPYLYPANKNYFHGVNFASVGAGALVDTFKGFAIDLKTQLSYFNKVAKVLKKKLGHVAAKALLSRSVYFISIGSSDYFIPFTPNSTLLQSHSAEDYVDFVIGNLTAVIKGIHKNGGRKFVFQNVGNIGCFPIVKVNILQGKDVCFEEMTELAKLHNKRLSNTLLTLGKKLQGFTYSYADFYSANNDIMDNPAKYGFKEGKVACCGSGPFRGLDSCGGKRGIKEYELCENPNEYSFFDASHPSEKANEILAKLFWRGNSKIIRPLNLKALFHV